MLMSTDYSSLLIHSIVFRWVMPKTLPLCTPQGGRKARDSLIVPDSWLQLLSVNTIEIKITLAANTGTEKSKACFALPLVTSPH